MSMPKPPFSVMRSLRVDMVIAFGGLLLVTVLVVIFYFYNNTSRMVWILCDDIMEQTTHAVIDGTINFFTPLIALTEMSSRIAAAGILPSSNSETLERYSVEILNAFPQVARFIVGDLEGNFLSGEFLGVMGCDIELKGLSTFLESLRVGKHGLAFIVSEKDSLVAFPHAPRVVDTTAEHGIFRMITVEDVEKPGIPAAFKEHRTSGAARVTVEAGGQKYLATFRAFPPSFAKPWKVAVVVPEDDFIGKVKESYLIRFSAVDEKASAALDFRLKPEENTGLRK